MRWSRLGTRSLRQGVARAFGSTAVERGAEFTLALYVERLNAFSRGSSFALATLRHPVLHGKTMMELDAMYDTKAQVRAELMDRYFQEADEDASGSLDREELLRILLQAGLPATEARVEQILSTMGSSNHLKREQFRLLLDEVWGSRLASLEFHGDLCSKLGMDSYNGERAVCFVFRSAPEHQLLRLFRHMWPYPVESIALLTCREKNPELNPHAMRIFDETYVPSVPEEKASVFRFINSAIDDKRTDPAKTGGYVVRLRGPHVQSCETGESMDVYVPLRIIVQNPCSTTAAASFSGVSAPELAARYLGDWLYIVVIGVVVLAAGQTALLLHIGWNSHSQTESRGTEKEAGK